MCLKYAVYPGSVLTAGRSLAAAGAFIMPGLQRKQTA
jgi:hypothetical protein